MDVLRRKRRSGKEDERTKRTHARVACKALKSTEIGRKQQVSYDANWLLQIGRGMFGNVSRVAAESYITKRFMMAFLGGTLGVRRLYVIPLSRFVVMIYIYMYVRA
jgi:hypothetical protein